VIWYAAYGSNLSRDRFDCYLNGGTPDGAKHAYPGCRDASEPKDDRAGEIDAELAFGGTSLTWGGGVAFVSPEQGHATKVRMYLITLEQFEDLVAQENWLTVGEVKLHQPVSEERIVGPEHVYGCVLPLGELDGHPVLTVTQHRGTREAKPTIPYVRHIAQGLREAYAMTDDEIVEYLAPKRGLDGAIGPRDLALALRWP
jgi:hypothetical protein